MPERKRGRKRKSRLVKFFTRGLPQIIFFITLAIAPTFWVSAYYQGRQLGINTEVNILSTRYADLNARVVAVAIHNLELNSLIRLQDDALRELTLKEQARIKAVLGGRTRRPE